MKDTYDICYCVYLVDGTVIRDKDIKIHNNESELQAKIRLEGYLRKKYPDFLRLEITSCKNDFMSIFGNMFGKDNPFKF